MRRGNANPPWSPRRVAARVSRKVRIDGDVVNPRGTPGGQDASRQADAVSKLPRAAVGDEFRQTWVLVPAVDVLEGLCGFVRLPQDSDFPLERLTHGLQDSRRRVLEIPLLGEDCGQRVIGFAQQLRPPAIGHGRAQHETAHRCEPDVDLERDDALLSHRRGAEGAQPSERSVDRNPRDRRVDQRGSWMAESKTRPDHDRKHQVLERMRGQRSDVTGKHENAQDDGERFEGDDFEPADRRAVD